MKIRPVWTYQNIQSIQYFRKYLRVNIFKRLRNKTQPTALYLPKHHPFDTTRLSPFYRCIDRSAWDAALLLWGGPRSWKICFLFRFKLIPSILNGQFSLFRVESFLFCKRYLWMSEFLFLGESWHTRHKHGWEMKEVQCKGKVKHEVLQYRNLKSSRKWVETFFSGM